VKGVNWLDCGPIQLSEEAYVHLAIDLEDWGALAAYLAAGYPFTEELRAYTVQVYRKRTRLKKRPVKLSTITLGTLVAGFLAELGQTNIKPAKAKEIVAEAFNCTPRTIARWVKGITLTSPRKTVIAQRPRQRSKPLTFDRARELGLDAHEYNKGWHEVDLDDLSRPVASVDDIRQRLAVGAALDHILALSAERRRSRAVGAGPSPSTSRDNK
jgi:hypothetical protein